MKEFIIGLFKGAVVFRSDCRLALRFAQTKDSGSGGLVPQHQVLELLNKVEQLI
jgi:hypothetical protein